MNTFLLGACLAAVLVSPALAQTYDQGGYQDPQAQDQGDQYGGDQFRGGQDQSDRGYQDDRSYQDDRGYQDDRSRDDRGYNREGWARDDGRDVPRGAHYTNRVGSSWRDGDGRDCAWRELTWRDDDGAPAYKWVARCRD
jgi:hypothetical protein